ncbi:hypothetical protein C0J52_27625 [Blattella germanica]|nr:hypothetical protein C0J52_27625 [Blattella germanica]
MSSQFTRLVNAERERLWRRRFVSSVKRTSQRRVKIARCCLCDTTTYSSHFRSYHHGRRDSRSRSSSRLDLVYDSMEEKEKKKKKKKKKKVAAFEFAVSSTVPEIFTPPEIVRHPALLICETSVHWSTVVPKNYAAAEIHFYYVNPPPTEVHGVSDDGSTRRIDMIAFQDTNKGWIIDPTIKCHPMQTNQYKSTMKNVASTTLQYHTTKKIPAKRHSGTRINGGNIRWAGHVQRLDGEYILRRTMDGNLDGLKRVRRPNLRLLDGLLEDLRSLGVKVWWRMTRDRSAWRRILLPHWVLGPPGIETIPSAKGKLILPPQYFGGGYQRRRLDFVLALCGESKMGISEGKGTVDRDGVNWWILAGTEEPPSTHPLSRLHCHPRRRRRRRVDFPATSLQNVSFYQPQRWGGARFARLNWTLRLLSKGLKQEV